MKKLLTLVIVVVALFAFAVPAFAYGDADATVSSAIVDGNNWNQGKLVITVTDARGEYSLDVPNNPGNGNHTRNVGPYIVNLHVQGNTPTVTITGHSHVYDDAVTAPTCTAEGFTTYTCYICGGEYTDDTVAARGHEEGAGVVTIEATCTADGVMTFYCIRCAEELRAEVIPGGHDYQLTVRAATCEADGAEFYGCSRCGDWHYGEIFPAFGHNLLLVEDRAATCEADGAQFFACTNEGCQHWEYGEIYQALGHVFAYSMREDGQWFKSCTRDGCNYWDYADAPSLTNVATSAKDFISIVETSKNSRVWTLSFWVTEAYSYGNTQRVQYSINLNGNNANLDGKYDLGNGYILIYDIKGNGSNIKDFRIIAK